MSLKTLPSLINITARQLLTATGERSAQAMSAGVRTVAQGSEVIPVMEKAVPQWQRVPREVLLTHCLIT